MVSIRSSTAAARLRDMTHGRHCHEHDHELFLAENRVTDECVEESGQAAPTLFDKGPVVGQVVPVDGDTFWGQEW